MKFRHLDDLRDYNFVAVVSTTNVLWWIRGAISTLQLDKISPLVEMTDYVETINMLAYFLQFPRS
ncbi:MAG: hypothetical protein ABFS56_21100 [Pseudomonadota bacterium]